jgi:hypothetical protein
VNSIELLLQPQDNHTINIINQEMLSFRRKLISEKKLTSKLLNNSQACVRNLVEDFAGYTTNGDDCDSDEERKKSGSESENENENENVRSRLDEELI